MARETATARADLATAIHFRTSAEKKSLIERAAAVVGKTVSGYAEAVLVEKSREVVEQNETRVLSDRDRDIFLALLDSPPAPNAALREAAADYRKALQSGELTVR